MEGLRNILTLLGNLTPIVSVIISGLISIFSIRFAHNQTVKFSKDNLRTDNQKDRYNKLYLPFISCLVKHRLYAEVDWFSKLSNEAKTEIFDLINNNLGFMDSSSFSAYVMFYKYANYSNFDDDPISKIMITDNFNRLVKSMLRESNKLSLELELPTITDSHFFSRFLD